MKSFKLLLMTLLTSCFIFAGNYQPQNSFHTDSRSGLVKLEFVPATNTKVRRNPELVAQDYIRTNADKFGISGNMSDLYLARVSESLIGRHYHYQQLLNGYKVHNAELIISVSKNNGQVFQVYNNAYPVSSQNKMNAAKPAISQEKAYDIAWAQMRVHGDVMADPNAELVYMPEGDSFRLVYLTDLGVSAPFGYWQHQIDARTGEILEVRDTAIARNPKDAVDFEAYNGPIANRQEAFNRYEEKATFEAAEQATLSKTANKAAGSGKTFDPDPVTTLQTALSDTSSASSFTNAYFTRNLNDITLSGGVYSLTGPWVTIKNIESPNTAPSTTTNGSWTATRGNNAFNDSMTYFQIDQNQRYMQSLGFSGSTGIQYLSINVDTDGVNGDDNSHFVPSTNILAFGHGCVDDNEDTFVILHEYGHAINKSINNSWSGGDTGAMGEGWGDYWAGSYKFSTPNGATYHPEWAFPWDGHNSCWGGRMMNTTSAQYVHSTTYGAHQTVSGFTSDELWSTPLFQSLLALTAQGVPRTEVDKILLQAQFGLGSGLKMRDMANAIVNAAQTLFPSGPHKDVFSAKFQAQAILTGTTTPPPTTGVTTLSNGVASASFSGSAGTQLFFKLVVPSGATNLKFVMSGGTGDADLYVKFGSQPTTSSYDGKSEGGTNSETVNISTAQAGTYYVTVNGYSTFSGASLTGSYSTGTTPPPPTGTVTAVNQAVSGAKGSKTYFSVAVPSGATNLKFALSGGSGDADLYVRIGSNPTTSNYGWRSWNSGNTENITVAAPTAGTYKVMVYGYSAYSGATILITYNN